VLRVTAGPRADWVTGGVRRLAGPTWNVAADSDRVALRLAGPPLDRERADELPSEGLVLGAVQVPPDGQPLVFLADHPTTGGYPVLGVVHPVDLWQCAQLRPGDPVVFRHTAG
jgi:allophanate hydrolase subunit 2